MGKTRTHENGKQTTIRQTVTGSWAAEKGGWLGPDRIVTCDTEAEAERAAERDRGSPIKK
jgi:hypothetical protein